MCVQPKVTITILIKDKLTNKNCFGVGTQPGIIGMNQMTMKTLSKAPNKLILGNISMLVNSPPYFEVILCIWLTQKGKRVMTIWNWLIKIIWWKLITWLMFELFDLVSHEDLITWFSRNYSYSSWNRQPLTFPPGKLSDQRKSPTARYKNTFASHAQRKSHWCNDLWINVLMAKHVMMGISLLKDKCIYISLAGITS